MDISKERRICEKTGGITKPIGKKFLRHEMQIVPQQTKLLAYYAFTYACDHCKKDTAFANFVTENHRFRC